MILILPGGFDKNIARPGRQWLSLIRSSPQADCPRTDMIEVRQDEYSPTTFAYYFPHPIDRLYWATLSSP